MPYHILLNLIPNTLCRPPTDLSVEDGFRPQSRQHLVEGVEQEVDIDPEGVLVLTPGGPGEQDPGLDDEL